MKVCAESFRDGAHRTVTVISGGTREGAPVAAGDGGIDLAAITEAASVEAGGVPSGLLGGYLPAVLDAARTGRRLSAPELGEYGSSGERAAESGVALRGLVDLYLSATWRLWRELPAGAGSASTLRAAGLAVLRAADDAVAAAAEGFERAHLAIARREEAERREFFDDVLTGRGRVGDLIARGERLGLLLAGPHQIILVGPAAADGPPAQGSLDIDMTVAAAAAPASSLVASRGGRIVVIVGAAGGNEAGRVAAALPRALTAVQPPGAWRIAIGRAYPGPSGVARSYDEAAAALDVAQRLALPDPLAVAADLLIYQVLLRDRAAITDLVRTVLSPLARSRGGAKPLLETLAAYFGCGGVAAAAARQLHLSVRALTYRLARVAELTGRDPADPRDALALHVAVVGAQLLGWPDQPLEPA